MSPLLGSDDHWFTLTVATLVVIGLYVTFSIPWYWALVAGMLVSGVIEFAIKEIPPDPDVYNSNQYQLWDKAFGGSQNTLESTSRETSTDSANSLEVLRTQYARGEVTDEQLEQKIEKLLETESLDEPKEQGEARELLIDRTD